MSWEKIDVIRDPAIPEGYQVTFHQIRGYDSPSKWFEVKRGPNLIGEYHRRLDAIAAAVKDAESKPKTAWERLGDD